MYTNKFPWHVVTTKFSSWIEKKIFPENNILFLAFCLCYDHVVKISRKGGGGCYFVFDNLFEQLLWFSRGPY